MGVLTKDAILAEIERGRIQVSPFDPAHVGPASVDLRLAGRFRLFNTRKCVVPVTEIADYKRLTHLHKVAEGDYLFLTPRQTVLGITLEKVSLPDDVCGWIACRGRFARVGLAVHAAAPFVQPGVSNHQVLKITNLGAHSVALRPGTRVCQIVLCRTEGHGRYTGRYRRQSLADF